MQMQNNFRLFEPWQIVFHTEIVKTAKTKSHLKLLLHTTKLVEPTDLIFGMTNDADHIYYCTTNQARGLCVGGDMVISGNKH